MHRHDEGITRNRIEGPRLRRVIRSGQKPFGREIIHGGTQSKVGNFARQGLGPVPHIEDVGKLYVCVRELP